MFARIGNFEVIVGNGMSMGFSNAKFGPAKNDFVYICFEFITFFIIKLFNINLIKNF